LRTRVHEDLIQELDPEQLVGDTGYTSAARRAVEQAAEEKLAAMDASLIRSERLRLASEIADEVLGLGPLEPLLRDPTVTEIMVNAWDRVYFERDGLIQRADTSFRDDPHVLNIIDKILRPVSRRLDDSSPMVDARLPDGSRVNAVIPPLAVHGPSLTIRKFSRELLSASDLVQDDPAELAVGVHSAARAHRHHRGPGRAADQAGRLGQPGDAAAEHRGQGSGPAARPR
jgi:pilus assembly protein CpaF